MLLQPGDHPQTHENLSLADDSTSVPPCATPARTPRARRSFRHWTPTYVRNRIRLEVHQRTHTAEPWLTAPAVQIIESWLEDSDVGLEWGSGRSTSWFAERVSRLVSVEHDESWYVRVCNDLKKRGRIGKSDVRLRPDGLDGGPDSSYVQVATELDDKSLDFVLIDGVARDHCARAVVEKLRPGGLLIVDNIERYIPRHHPSSSPSARSLSDEFASPAWQQFSDAVKAWRLIWTTNGVSDTALWFKPAA